MFTFGIGSSVNRHLIEGMAHVGMGEPFIVTRPEEAPAQAGKLRKMIASPVLTNIEVDYGKFDVYGIEPPAVPDILAERPVIVFGKWRGSPEGEIRLTGTGGNGAYIQTFKVAETPPREINSALKYLWARSRIARLSDFNTQRGNPENRPFSQLAKMLNGVA